MATLAKMSDADLDEELRQLSRRIMAAIQFREDLIEEMVRRGVRERRLYGLQAVVDAVAARLELPAPQVGEAPLRPRDETNWWTNTSSVAEIVRVFLEQRT